MATKHINTADFKKEVVEYKGTVMVDFFAEWCGPCKMTSPIIDQLNDEFGQKVKFLKVDVDQNNDLAGQFNVFSIPTFLIFKDGKAVGQLVGAQSKDAFKAEISKVTPL